MLLSLLNRPEKVLLPVLAIVLPAFITACGNSGDSQATPASPNTSTETTTTDATSGAGTGGGPVVPPGSEVAIGAPGTRLNTNQPPEATAVGLGLRAGDGTEKDGLNLISLAGDWPSWSGQYTGIWFDPASNRVNIPPAAWPGQMITGVRRFYLALTPGQSYALSIDSNVPDAAGVLFLYNSAGGLVPITDTDTGVTSEYAIAKTKDPLRFYAPPGVASIVVQIQNAWNSSAAANLAATLAATNGTLVQTQAAAATNVLWGERPAGYDTMFFSDEFDGGSLDRSKWCTRYDYGGGPALQVPDGECTKFNAMGVLDYANAFEEQRYRDYNTWGEALHVVGGGTIKLRATKTSSAWYAKYEAAALRAKRVFKPNGQTSYFITAKVKMPNVKGTWPSIWLNPSLEPWGAAQWPPEIDIFEGPLNGVEERAESVVQTVQGSGAQWDWNWSTKHYDTAPGYNKQWDTYNAPSSLRDRWVVISAEWTWNAVCFYVDNVKTTCQRYRWITNSYQEANPASLLLNLAIGGPWAGRYGIEEWKFPTQFEIDYVRVYRRGPANY